jgi:hypothetical protein
VDFANFIAIKYARASAPEHFYMCCLTVLVFCLKLELDSEVASCVFGIVACAGTCA